MNADFKLEYRIEVEPEGGLWLTYVNDQPICGPCGNPVRTSSPEKGMAVAIIAIRRMMEDMGFFQDMPVDSVAKLH